MAALPLIHKAWNSGNEPSGTSGRSPVIPFFLSPIRVKLALLALLPVLPILTLFFYTDLEQRRHARIQAQAGAGSLSQLAAENQANFIKNARQLLATLSGIPFLVHSTNRSLCQTHFSNLLRLAPEYLNFGLMESNGTVFASAVPTPGPVDLSDRSYFQRAVESRRFSIGEFQAGRLTRKETLNFGYPILDEEQRVKRVLFASLNLELLSKSAAQVRLPAGATITVVDRGGTILARSPQPGDWVGKSLPQEPMIAQALQMQEGIIEAPGLDGVERWHAVTPIRDGQAASLFVGVGIPIETSLAQAKQVQMRNLVVLGAVALLSLVVARWYAERSIMRTIDVLVEAVERLTRGDLSARTHIPPQGSELNQLAGAFDLMASTLQARQEEICQMNLNLEKRIQERTAQVAAINQELEAFSYSVSHDLRAPLRHMAGFAQLLREDYLSALDGRGQRYVRVISDAAKRMGTLIDDLLVFSRMGRQEMCQSIIDTPRLVADVIILLEPELKGRSIAWKVNELPAVRADPAMLRQVWINLISNAIKYTRPCPKPLIEIGAETQPQAETVFYVRDNGVGFDMEYAHKLFGVFQRLHRDSEFEGTGIGLANVRRIVSRHGGRTWAEGKIGEGAKFYFSLPTAGVRTL